MKLEIIKSIPKELLNCKVEDLHKLLNGPTLIHLENENNSTIFISTLLHGNEHSGFYSIQNILNELHSNKLVPKHSILIFIGNIKAAKENLRQLPGQPDFNRIWNGGDSDESKVISKVIEYCKNLNLFCSVDIHNNTGKNPYYACINRTEDSFLSLAMFFFDKIVYFTEPHEVQSMAFSQFCPSVTLEVGQSNDRKGVEIIAKKLRVLFKKDSLILKKEKSEIEVYHTKARIRVDNNAIVNFDGKNNGRFDISFIPHLEDLNFKKVKRNTTIAFIGKSQKVWLESKPMKNCFNDYFYINNNQLITKKDIVPAMLTRNISVIKSDCLGYIMERLKIL